MPLIRWEPAREISSLQSEMNRLFNTFFDAPSGPGDGAAVRRWVPNMDLLETEDGYVLRADLPGLDQDDVAIEVEDRVLTVSGERKADHEASGRGFYRVERAFGAFSRTLTLPEGVDPQAISAEFEKGVLEVRIPKPVAPTPKRVSIAVGGVSPQTIEGSEAASAAVEAQSPAAGAGEPADRAGERGTTPEAV